MASKNVLTEAINKLVTANSSLRKKMNETDDKKKRDEYL